MDILDDDGLLELGPRARRTDPAAVTREEREKHRLLPKANPSLAEWGPTSEPAADDAATCHADERDAKYHCKQCGRGACAQHFWVMFGLCRECATQDRVGAIHREKRPEDRNWLED